MKDFLKQLKFAFAEIKLVEILSIILIAFFVNHLTQPEYFPFDSAYQFPFIPITFTLIVGLLILLIAKLNFRWFKKQYFSKKITLRNLLQFFGSSLVWIALFYVPFYLLVTYINEEEIVLYDFVISILLSLLLCSIYLIFGFAKSIYDLHQWTVIDGKLSIKRGEKTTLINYADIAYCYSKEKMVYLIKMDKTTLSTDFTLSQLETLLDDATFFRINRKIIIHFQAVAKVIAIENSKLTIQLNPDFSDIDSQPIIISRYKKQTFQNWLRKKLKPSTIQ